MKNSHNPFLKRTFPEFLEFILILVFSAAVLVLIPSFGSARTQYPSSPLGYVSDFAHILGSQQIYILDRYLHNYHQATGNQVEVAIVPTIGNNTAFNYSHRLFQKWGIGQKRVDKGVLALIAMKQHKIFFQVGYGLEPKLTDLQSHHIIRKYMVPYFRHEEFYQGIGAGLEKITQTIDGKPFSSISSISLQPYPRSSNTFNAGTYIFGFMIFMIALFLFIRYPSFMGYLLLNMVLSGGGGGGGFGGGFGWGGGGIGGFMGGGGSSGGGGAGGSW